MLIGRFEHTIDAKNRVSIPSKLRKEFTELGCMIVKGTVQCIYIYPMEKWSAEVLPRLEKLDTFNHDHARLKREYLSWSSIDTLDTQSRLLLPQKLLEYASINKDVLLIGTLDKIELWNPEVYENYINQQPLSFEQITEDVMTKL